MSVTMKQASDLFRSRRPFDASSVYARRLSLGYVVYSYGEHFPLFIFSSESGIWYVNADRYSATTSRHRSFFMRHLDGLSIAKLPTASMHRMAENLQ